MPKAKVMPIYKALYYPYIRIRDVNWLKATVLSFGQVQRMVPRGYRPDDRNGIEEFTGVQSRLGPLLTEADLYSEPVHRAQLELRDKINENIDFFRDRLAKHAAIRQHSRYDAAFEIHEYKLLGPLAETLLSNGLAWRRRTANDPNWLAVHPIMGEIVMSTLGQAVAKDSKLHLVTYNSKIDELPIDMDLRAMCRKLAGFKVRRSPDDLSTLTRIVITSTFFDLRALTPEIIAALINDGRAFHDLRIVLEDRLTEVPTGITNERELRQTLEAIAQDVIQSWERETKGIGLRFLSAGALTVTEAYKAYKRVTPGPFQLLAGVKGIMIGLKGIGPWLPGRLQTGPYRYLSRIEKRADQNTAGLYLPAWSQLAGPSRLDSSS